MKHIFVDFEMNAIDQKHKVIMETCQMEIIEIGAVLLDEKNLETESFKLYIKPEYNEHIMPMFVEMTGITDEMVKDAPNFREGFTLFLDWCNTFAGENNYEIFAWSQSDLVQLKKELKLKKMNTSRPRLKWMLKNWKDYQKEYCRIAELKQQVSLDKALGSFNEEFNGQMHDALSDARNTAIIYSMMQTGNKAREIVKAFFNNEQKACEPITC